MPTKHYSLLIKTILMVSVGTVFMQCETAKKKTMEVYETSEKGNALTLISEFKRKKICRFNATSTSKC